LFEVSVQQPFLFQGQEHPLQRALHVLELLILHVRKFRVERLLYETIRIHFRHYLLLFLPFFDFLLIYLAASLSLNLRVFLSNQQIFALTGVQHAKLSILLVHAFVMSLPRLLIGIHLQSWLSLPFLAIDFGLPKTPFAVSHSRTAILVIQHVDQLLRIRNKLSAPPSSVFNRGLVPGLKDRMLGIERANGLEAPVDIWEMLIIEGEGSAIASLLEQFVNHLQHDGFSWRIGTVRISQYFVLPWTVLETRSHAHHVLNSASGAGQLRHEEALFLADNV
jgi:hypothetical protein